MPARRKCFSRRGRKRPAVQPSPPFRQMPDRVCGAGICQNTGKMPQQSYSDDVGGPFGHLLQGIMGSAENGDEPARMQGILAPAHLVQRPAGKTQGLVHADNGVILTSGFRKNGYLGFIGFRLGSPRIKLRHKTVQAQIKRKGIFMHPVPLGQFHLFHGHRHFVAQHDAGQQQQNSP